MGTNNVLITPLLEQEAVELSDGTNKGMYRKQILPRGKFNYKGELIDFDAIGKAAKHAFDNKALDQVAFQLADEKNRHNFDPEKYRGELADVELTDEGTFGVFDFSKFPDMQERIEKNKKFGVSARIERGYDSNGKKFSYAFSHVLGTLNPRVKGMKPWEAISLSNVSEDSEIVDLTDIELSEKDGDNVGTDGLKPDEIEAFRKFMADQQAIQNQLQNVSLSNEDDDDTVSPATQQAIQLAQDAAESAIQLARESQIELAQTRWSNTYATLVREGIPPKILDLAAPMMSLPDSDVEAIQLSDNDSVEPKAVVLSMLNEMKGIIDLSEAKGHEISGSQEDDPGYKNFRDQFFADQF